MAKQRFEAELGINTKPLEQGLQKAKGTFAGFSTSAISMGAGIAALTGLVTGLANAFKETERGMKLISQTGAAVKQTFREMLSGGFGITPTGSAQGFANIIAQFKVAGQTHDLMVQDLEDRRNQHKIQAEINQLMAKGADHTLTASERQKALTEALALQQVLTTQMNIDLSEELTNLKAAQAAGDNTYELKKRIADKELELIDLSGREAEYRRLISQTTSLQAEEQQRLTDLQRESLQYLESGYKLTTIEGKGITPAGWMAATGRPLGFNVDTGTLRNMEGPDLAADKARNMNMALAEQEETLLRLSDTFAGFFNDVNMGFQGMIDGVVTGIKRLVMELAAKAAILGILQLITGMPLLTMSNLIPGLSGINLGGRGGGGRGGGGVSPSSMRLQAPQLEVFGTILGKDIQLSSRRYN